MKTCVVAIAGLASVDNFRHLPMSFTETVMGEEHRFLIHTDPKVEYRSHQKSANYDLLIDLNYITEHHDADYISKRLTKMEQSVRLAEISNTIEAHYFNKIPLLNKVANPTNMFDMVNLPDLVLVKSTDGARGVGHLIFDTTKASIFKFFNELRNLSTAPGDAPDIDPFDKLLDKYKHAIEVHQGQLNYPGEVKEIFTTHALMVTPIVTGVIREIRVLLNGEGVATLVKSRERKNTLKEGFGKDMGYLQATGANRDSSTLVESLLLTMPETHVKMVDEIEEFLTHLPPLNSVDLYLTKDGWGIFEYCNQFGTEAFEIGDVVGLHTGFIAKLWEEKLAKQNNGIRALPLRDEQPRGGSTL